MFGLFIVFKNPPVNCHSTLIWQYLSRACPKTICSAHFVASLCRTLCRTVRFLAIFDKVRRQSARQRSRASFVGQALSISSSGPHKIQIAECGARIVKSAMPLNVLIVTDKFKGTLNAQAAAEL